MKKTLFSSITIICALAIGLGIYSNQKTTIESDLMLQYIEAMACGETYDPMCPYWPFCEDPEGGGGGGDDGWLSDWWNSKVYACVSETCLVAVWNGNSYWGSREKCQSGSSYAHCWECDSTCW